MNTQSKCDSSIFRFVCFFENKNVSYSFLGSCVSIITDFVTAYGVVMSEVTSCLFVFLRPGLQCSKNVPLSSLEGIQLNFF